uniref:C2H2-type domain-containing protein n=1 Tax=Anopheles atroparvus TaxID=41427 RepID=A0AAG5DWF5_ANOAO
MEPTVECPVCTLYLRAGMSLEEHLDTHPKEKVIKTLASISLKKANLGATSEQTQQPQVQQQQQQQQHLLPLQSQTPTSALPAFPAGTLYSVTTYKRDASSLEVPSDIAVSGAAPSALGDIPEEHVTARIGGMLPGNAALPRYTNERYSGPPPPYKSRRVQQQGQEPQQQQQQHIQAQSQAKLQPTQPQVQQQQQQIQQKPQSQQQKQTQPQPEQQQSQPQQQTNSIMEAAKEGSVNIQSESPVLFTGLIAPHVDAPQPIPGRAVTIQRIENTTDAPPVRKRPEDVRVLSDVKVTAPLSECYKDVILNLKSKKIPLSIGDKTSLIQPSMHRAISLNASDSEPLLNDSVNELVINPESDMPDIDFGQVDAIEIRNEGDDDEDGGLNDPGEQCMQDDADVSEESAECYKRRRRRAASRCGGTKRMRGMAGKDCYTGNLSLKVKTVSTVVKGTSTKMSVTTVASSSKTSYTSAMVTSVIRKTPQPVFTPLAPPMQSTSAPQAKPAPAARQYQYQMLTPRARESMEANASDVASVSSDASVSSVGSSCPEAALEAASRKEDSVGTATRARVTTATNDTAPYSAPSTGSDCVEIPDQENDVIEIASSSADTLETYRPEPAPSARSPASARNVTGCPGMDGKPNSTLAYMNTHRDGSVSVQTKPTLQNRIEILAQRAESAKSVNPKPIMISSNAAQLAAARASVPPRNASKPRIRQTAHLSMSRPAPGAIIPAAKRDSAQVDVSARELMLAKSRAGNRSPVPMAHRLFASHLAVLAPGIEKGDYKLRYVSNNGDVKYETLRHPESDIRAFMLREGIDVKECTITEEAPCETDSVSDDAEQSPEAGSVEQEERDDPDPDELLTIWSPDDGSADLDLPTREEEAEEEEEEEEDDEEDEDEDEEEEDEDDADDEEYGDEEEDHERDDKPDERPPDAGGRGGQEEPHNRQEQDDKHQREQRDQDQQKRRGQSKRQQPKKDDGFQSQEDEEMIATGKADSHALPAPEIKQEQGQFQEKLLTHASLECFEMVETTAVAEVEVESEEIGRKPLDKGFTAWMDVDEEGGTVSSLSLVPETYPARGAVKSEGQPECCPPSAGSQPENICVLTTPGEVRDFFEAGPSSQKSCRCESSGAFSKQQPGNSRPPGHHLHADDKDYLEAGPSTRALPPSNDVGAGAAITARTPTHRSAFQEYDWFRHSLSLQPSSASGATTPTEQDGIPLAWARKFSPQYSSAALAASGGLLDGGDESLPEGEADEGAEVKRNSFRRSDGHGGANDSSSSDEEEVPLCDSKAMDTIRGTSDTSVSLDGHVDGGGGCGRAGSGGAGNTTGGGEIVKIEGSGNRHSSVSSIASNSLERSPSTESLNIRTDEKMPAKGEISEQESNGDMEMTSWNRLCAVNENFPVYPSSYDPSTAQECWNLSNRNLGNHSAFLACETGAGPPFFSKAGGNYNSLTHSYLSPRIPFPFSSGSQTLLSSYPSRGNACASDCKDEEDVEPDDEDDEDEDDEEERERSGSMKRLIPKIRFDESPFPADSTGSGQQQQQQQQQQLKSISGAPFVDGMLEEKYSPEAAGTSHFVGVVSEAHAIAMDVQGATTTMSFMPTMHEPKPSGSGTARTYRCTKCPKAFNSIKQRREHQHQEHPGNGQLQQVGKQPQKQQPKHKLEPQLLAAACEYAEESKEGILAEKPAPARLLPVVMNYDWLRMEIQRKYELASSASNHLVDVSAATVVHRRSFVCPICQVEFERFNQFNTHLSVHPAECLACGRYFKQWRNFTLHLKRHLGIKEHGCRVCGKHFVIKQKLIEHMRVHTGHAPIRCKLCNRHFKRFSNLAQHSNRYHLNKAIVKHEYVCSQCGDVFPTRAKMEWHKETHDQKPKPCPYCREKFIHQNSLTRHVRLSHTDKYAKLENKTEPCTVCQQPYTKASMRRHMETHAEGRLVFSCSICNKHFTTNWNLKQHKWTHANPTMKPFQCTLCPTGFVRESDYLTHVNSHRSIRPYTCNHCGRQFIRKYNWLRHSREHETDKGHNCEVCGRQFHRKYYLTEHKRIHTGERPYACNICGKTSSTKTNHNKHVRIHHARDPLTAEG